MKASRLLIPLLLFISAPTASAMSLWGVVSAVPDGQSIVIVTNGRKLSVVLKGVAAPGLAQEFGDVARQHLASLVLDKTVQVEFSELQADHVVGKVFCNQIDMGLQVIRDGAAWYYKTTAYNLTEIERNVYVEAEQAARSELRGIWQNGSPMPPWEWRRAEAFKSAPQVTTTSRRGRSRGLETEDIVFSGRKSVANTPGNSSSRASLPKPSSKPLNAPGQNADFRSYLNQGRISVVYFYADWCPTCRGLSPVMAEINARIPDMQVLFMDIGDWNTPVTQQYGISYVPYLKIYDKSGNLVADGKSARQWLLNAVAERK